MVTPPDINNPRPGDYFWMPSSYPGKGDPMLRQVKVLYRTKYWCSGDDAVTFTYLDHMPTAENQTVKVDYFKQVAKLAPPTKKVGRRVSLDAIIDKQPCYDGMIRAIEYWKWKHAGRECKLDMYQAYIDGKLSKGDAIWLVNEFKWRQPSIRNGEGDWIAECLQTEEY